MTDAVIAAMTQITEIVGALPEEERAELHTELLASILTPYLDMGQLATPLTISLNADAVMVYSIKDKRTKLDLSMKESASHYVTYVAQTMFDKVRVAMNELPGATVVADETGARIILTDKPKDG